jgi:D-arabinose 1-dehydrogenase-like Zn-dependent alcohol dehydrogenase
VAELQKPGGARVILMTAPNAKAISALVDGLSPSGKLLVPAAPNEPLTVSTVPLTGVHRIIEKCLLSRVTKAYEQMHSGKVRFRVALTMDG